MNHHRPTFSTEILDEVTGSIWNVLGAPASGELGGERLEEHGDGSHFWFAWVAFPPDTGIWVPWLLQPTDARIRRGLS